MKLNVEIPVSSLTYNGIEVPLAGGGKVPAIFGDGSDGVGLMTTNTTWLADTEDTGMIVKNFESLTISEGVTVSAGNRNCGMIIRVQGDFNLYGSIVNKLAPKSILDSDHVDFTTVYPASMLTSIAGNGGAGGTGGAFSGTGAAGGAGMTGRLYGGGYSGGGGGGARSGISNGGNGGGVNALTTADTRGLFIGGAAGEPSPAGDGINGGGGAGRGGAGSPAAGASGAGADGPVATGTNDHVNGSGGGAGNYGGGVVIILVGGNVTVAGTIDCSGGNGGKGGPSGGQKAGGGGGGGGGGGRIFICHKGTISNTGTLNVNGGAGGARGSGSYYQAVAGTAGSIGTTAIKTYEQYMEEDVA